MQLSKQARAVFVAHGKNGAIKRNELPGVRVVPVVAAGLSDVHVRHQRARRSHRLLVHEWHLAVARGRVGAGELPRVPSAWTVGPALLRAVVRL